jgi:hypothetical protein
MEALELSGKKPFMAFFQAADCRKAEVSDSRKSPLGCQQHRDNNPRQTTRPNQLLDPGGEKVEPSRQGWAFCR